MLYAQIREGPHAPWSQRGAGAPSPNHATADAPHQNFWKKAMVKKKAELSSAQVQQGGMKRCERTRLLR